MGFSVECITPSIRTMCPHSRLTLSHTSIQTILQNKKWHICSTRISPNDDDNDVRILHRRKTCMELLLSLQSCIYCIYPMAISVESIRVCPKTRRTTNGGEHALVIFGQRRKRTYLHTHTHKNMQVCAHAGSFLRTWVFYFIEHDLD